MARKVNAIALEFDEDKESVGLLIEQLRYAGVLSVKREYDSDSKPCLIIYAPKGVDTEIWANMNVKRMASFSLKAQAVRV